MIPTKKHRNVTIKTSIQEKSNVLNNKTPKNPTIKYTGINLLDKSNSLKYIDSFSTFTLSKLTYDNLDEKRIRLVVPIKHE